MCLDVSVEVGGGLWGVSSFLPLSGPHGPKSGLAAGSFTPCHRVGPVHSFNESSDFLLLIKDNSYKFRRRGLCLGSVETPKSSKGPSQ